MIDVKEAATYLLSYVRDPDLHPGGYASYGYDLLIPNVIDAYMQMIDPDNARKHWGSEDARDLSPAFYAAAWDLCRRGIIRPGVRRLGAQATTEGSGGDGYSVTPFGEQWLNEDTNDAYIPTEPGRFAEMLEPHRDRYGPGFYERSQEAIRCYGAHAYLACCVMCGAAAEAILLAATIRPRGRRGASPVCLQLIPGPFACRNNASRPSLRSPQAGGARLPDAVEVLARSSRPRGNSRYQ